MNAKANQKIFFDAVHGYIYISPEYCQNIIDTPHYQRLKRLEQTNIRPLYPCAHHDRFIHSLGTFHIGKLAFEAIKSNSADELRDNKINLNWRDAQAHFELACLLHDIGHAPFSHTFEKYFDINGSLDKYFNDLKIPEQYKGGYENFLNDYNLKDPKPKEHERTSAILVLTEYYNILKNHFNTDPVRIARMILGCKYNIVESISTEFDNCLIELLNGDTIDVDKLDYMARDQWASGNISKHIDYEKLLSSLYLKKNSEKKLVICFHKRAISELHTIAEIKNLLNVRLHSHHIVKYDMYVLQKALEETTELFFNNGKLINRTEVEIGSAIHKIISIEALQSTVDFNGIKIRYPIDDDLIFILKSFLETSNYAKEWFNREYRLKAVWKTYEDFRYFFNEIIDIDANEKEDLRKVEYLFEKSISLVQSFLESQHYEKNEFYICNEVNPEYNPVIYEDINIFIKDKIIKLKDLKSKISKVTLPKYYFLLYLPQKIVKNVKLEKTFIKYLIKSVNEEFTKTGQSDHISPE